MPRPNLPSLSLDFASLRLAYSRDDVTPLQVVDEVYRRIAADDDPFIWLHVVPRETAYARARKLIERRAAGERLPLFGVPYGIKDNIDVAGVPTTAGCDAFAYVPEQSATVIERLDAAGALFIGKQNMDQFATGLVGTRNLTGHCRNAFSRAHIPGGSSSGSAVAVAKGHVAFSIGSDTGGSGRVPAACNNIVGLKPTPGLIGMAGFVYCNRTFDVAPVFALTVDDAYAVFDILVGHDLRDPFSSREAVLAPAQALPDRFRFGVVADNQLEFFGDRHAERQYARALDTLIAAGGEPVGVDFSPYLAAGDLVFNSALVAERGIAYGQCAAQHPEQIHPMVLDALCSASRYSAADVFDAIYRLREYRAAVDATFATLPLLVVPTCGTLPTCEAVAADPIVANARMGRYTYFANPLRLCAISVPSGMRDDGLPFGLSLIGPALSDRRLASLANLLHARTSTRLGATANGLPQYITGHHAVTDR
ncbi:allophanate hydrolase [Pandoraea sp. SD6-2]|uniref:allophanate hydrolase n=1 Tax=Pandoraea sp. SD6-2 TaxID=1286093 RepID=UPI00032EF72F|nr:allophanate hydrolase [Pandoraea sp. SD6-2]EON14092.1 allophanate hydrolase [Pandoraea sp. SD6-2]